MKPKPKKLIEKAMDDNEPTSDGESANNEPEASGGADLFDSLMSSNNESPKKTNGTKSAPSPVKGMDSSDDEADNTHDDAKNASRNSSANDDDDDPNTSKRSATATEENGDVSMEDADNTANTAGDDDEEGWEVEQIVGHKYKNGRKIYRVRWKNYTEADDTWQGEDDLSCPDLIAEYLASNPDETPTKKKQVRISLDPTRETPKRSATKKVVVESDDEDAESKSSKKTKKSPKKAKKAKAAKKEWAVLKIVGDKKIKGKLHYQIRWKGYSADDDTWEPKSSLSCPELIEKYEASKTEAGDEDVDYEVEKVVGEKVEFGVRYFLVKWKGWDESDNSWEPEDQVECLDLVEKFRDSCRSSVGKGKKRPAPAAQKSPTTPKKAKLTPKKGKSTPKKATPKNSSAKKGRGRPKGGKSTQSPRKSKRGAAVSDDDDDETNEDEVEYADASDNDGTNGTESDGELITGDDLEFEVEKIVEQRVMDDHKEYKIRWKGCSAKDDTWEHEDNISCPDILAAFLKKKKKK